MLSSSNVWTIFTVFLVFLFSFQVSAETYYEYLESQGVPVSDIVNDYLDSGEGESDALSSDQDYIVSNVENVVIQAENVLLANEAENFAVDGAPLSGAWWRCSFDSFSDVFIYVPLVNARDSFSWNADGIPINITGSSITGYIGGADYSTSIQFQPFSIPRYRLDNSYDYEYMSNFEYTDSTIEVFSSDSELDLMNEKDWLIIISFVVGLIFFISFIKGFF